MDGVVGGDRVFLDAVRLDAGVADAREPDSLVGGGGNGMCSADGVAGVVRAVLDVVRVEDVDEVYDDVAIKGDVSLRTPLVKGAGGGKSATVNVLAGRARADTSIRADTSMLSR